MIKQFSKEIITEMLLSDGHLYLGKGYKKVRFMLVLNFKNLLINYIMQSYKLVKSNIKEYDYLDLINFNKFK